MQELDFQKELIAQLRKDPQAVWERIKAFYPASEIKDLKGISASEDGFNNFAPMEPDYDVVLTNFHYGDQHTNVAPLLVSTRTYENNTDATIQESFSFSKTTEDTFSFGFDVGLKVGTKASIKAQVPFLGEAAQEISAEFQFSTNSQWTKRISKQWSSQDSIPVPPHTTVQVQGFVKQAKIKADFKGEAVATGGRFLVWFDIKDTVNNVREFPVPVSVMLPEKQRTLHVSGTFEGVEGVETLTKVDDVAVTPA